MKNLKDRVEEKEAQELGREDVRVNVSNIVVIVCIALYCIAFLSAQVRARRIFVDGIGSGLPLLSLNHRNTTRDANCRRAECLKLLLVQHPR